MNGDEVGNPVYGVGDETTFPLAKALNTEGRLGRPRTDLDRLSAPEDVPWTDPDRPIDASPRILCVLRSEDAVGAAKLRLLVRRRVAGGRRLWDAELRGELVDGAGFRGEEAGGAAAIERTDG
jgi:hypothetical protein